MADQNLNTPEEIWKEVPGFEGYEVSDQGRVRSYRLPGYGHKLADHPKILRPLWSQDGYKRAALSKKGRAYYFTVHRLVLLTFVGPCPTGMQACHNDGKLLNCYVDNLRWDTIKNNHLDKFKHGTTVRGERNGRCKLTVSQVKQIREMVSHGVSIHSLGKIFAVTPENINRIIKRRTWKHI